jgi:hypothetical protein
VYRKPTDTGLYLQYNSNHPKTVLNGIVNTLLHRANTHSSSEQRLTKEVEEVDKIIIHNKYPKRLIENIKRKRESQIPNKKGEKPEAVINIPYSIYPKAGGEN